MKTNYSKRRLENLQKNEKELQKKAKEVSKVKETIKVIALLMLIANIPIILITRILAVHARSIYNWSESFIINPKEFSKTKNRKGSRSRLTEKQKEQLKRVVIEGPQKAGYTRGTWTAAMIKEIIHKKFRVEYHTRYVPELLKGLGFSYIKAKWTCAGKDTEEVEKWKSQTWPELLAKAECESINIIFGDEASFALWGSLSYTWAITGQQPLIQTTGKRKKLKAFGALDYFSGKFTFSTLDGKLNSESFIDFLKKILVRFPGKIFFITDSAPYHKSKKVLSFLGNNHDRIKIVPLPAYAPEYNLVEYVWRRIKSYTHNIYFHDFFALTKFVHLRLKSAQKHSDGMLDLCASYPKIMEHNFRQSLDFIGS